MSWSVNEGSWWSVGCNCSIDKEKLNGESYFHIVRKAKKKEKKKRRDLATKAKYFAAAHTTAGRWHVQWGDGMFSGGVAQIYPGGGV